MVADAEWQGMFGKLMTALLASSVWIASPANASADCAIKPPASLVSAGTLTFGTMLSTPPQVFDNKGAPDGFDVDVAKAVAQRLCLKPAFVNLAFPGLFPGLNSKKFDAVVAGIGITPQREEVFKFVPYFEGGNQLVVRKASKLAFKDESELCGHSVATVTGSVEAHALERSNKELCTHGKTIEIKVYPSFNEAVQQLIKSNSDVAWVDWPFASYIVHLMPDLALGGPILSGVPGKPRNNEGIVVRKDDDTAQTAIQQAFAAVEASGDYDKLLAKWHLEGGDIRLVKP